MPIFKLGLIGLMIAFSVCAALSTVTRRAQVVAAHKSSTPLSNVPALSYFTLPTSGAASFNSIAVDAAGNTYVTGHTTAADFPTLNPIQRSLGDNHPEGGDAFVLKINATGTALVYATYLGGSGRDEGLGIAVDAAGQAYVVGTTRSNNFPAAGDAYGGGKDVFVAKLNAAGSALSHARYLGGDGDDSGNSIAVDATGNAYVTGGTTSTNFPTTPDAFQPTGKVTRQANGQVLGDAFITKLNPSGAALVYSTYLGGNEGAETGFDIAIDGEGNAYVTGEGASVADFPTTLGAFDKTTGNRFVVKLNAPGTALSYATLLGNWSASRSIGVDRQGNAYLLSTMYSPSGPGTPGAFQPVQPDSYYCFVQNHFLYACTNAVVLKLNAGGTALVYATNLGGQGREWARDLAVDSEGNAYVVGTTDAHNFPTTPDAVATGPGSFITKLNATGATLYYSTTLSDELNGGIALDPVGNVYVAGKRAQTGLIAKLDLRENKGTGAALVNVSAASFRPSTASHLPTVLAPESIVAAFGTRLATTTLAASTLPLPTELAGTTVKVRDSNNVERLAPLFFVSPSQVNYLVPAETNFSATVTVTSGDGSFSIAWASIDQPNPGLFTANADGRGVAAAVAQRRKADGTVSYEPVARFDPAENKFVAIPLDLGADSDQVVLSLFGTGIRRRPANVTAEITIGGTPATALYAGPQGEFAGLDQINVGLPRSLAGRGEVEIVVTVYGRRANTVSVNIK